MPAGFRPEAFQPNAFQYLVEPEPDPGGGTPDPQFRAYYRLAIASLGTGGLGTVIDPDVLALTGVPDGNTALQFSRVLNGNGSLEFSLPLDDAFVRDTILPNVGALELHLYRSVPAEDVGETLVWGGRLWQADITSYTTLRCSGSGWFSVLSRREVDEDAVFTNTDQLDIAWALIAATQANTGGALGITRGSASLSGVVRSIAYCLDGRENVADAIGELAAAEDGFDHEVGPDKVWRTWSPLRGSDTGIALDAALNVIGLDGLQFDASQVSNEVTGIKSGGSCETPVTEFALDTASRTKYGLLQSSFTNDGVSALHLQAMAEEALRIAREPRFQCTVTLDRAMTTITRPEVFVPDLLDYSLGDSVNLAVSRVGIDRSFRIVEIGVRARPGGLERVSLRLDGTP